MLRFDRFAVGRRALVLLLAAFILVPPVAQAAMPVSIRPLSDFLSAQGSSNGFIPPIPDFIGWGDSPFHRFASVDYAGLAAAWLVSAGGPNVGTTVDGTIVERRLADGRAVVTVTLRATSAITWVWGGDGDFATGPTQFGSRANELLADPSLTPALSNCLMRVEFINTAPGAPLPDLVEAFIFGSALPGQELRSLMFRASGTGPLHAVFGVAEGTPGKLVVSQTGILVTHFQGATADGFPAELVDLHPLH